MNTKKVIGIMMIIILLTIVIIFFKIAKEDDYLDPYYTQELLHKAAIGDSEAQYSLAWEYIRGYIATDNPDQEAFKLFKRSAKQGHSGSLYRLANYYYCEGHAPVKKDLNLSLYLFDQAIKLGINIDSYKKYHCLDAYEQNTRVNSALKANKEEK